MKQQASGFTLIELMTALAVLVITLTIGVPAFAGLQQRARAATAYHLLTSSLAIARLGAVKRGEAVGVCPSTNGSSCEDDTSWDGGWIVFSDPDRTGQPAAPNAVLQRIDGVGASLALRSTQGRTLVRFTPNGWAYGSNLSIRLCSREPARLLGKVVVNNGGRPRSERFEEAKPCPYPL
ncbi:GspH/FimT family pseudopilin [Novilysobacter erysipheiresistens]|uniref:Type II secretion system protein H n=1 Tax=Novilysobacter erysipheiresistens TaxID=1749332 RepID=A0ABU7YTS8_9GAMM